jgi:hypothetical protein
MNADLTGARTPSSAVEDFGEPWSHSSGGLYSREGPLYVVGVPMALAQRIVACVNACAGKDLGLSHGAATIRRQSKNGDGDESSPLPASDALTDRVNAWLSIAITKAVVKPIEGTDTFVATLPPFRKFSCADAAESAALAGLRSMLGLWAKNELNAGRDLPTWESKIPEVSPEAKRLVRLTNLKHELKTRAAAWGGERQLLPAGAVERCLADIDALVTRHAMQINGAPPPPKTSSP